MSAETNKPPIDYSDTKRDPLIAEFVAYAEEPFRVGIERARQIGETATEAILHKMLAENSLVARDEAEKYKAVEPQLKQLEQMLSMRRSSMERRAALATIIKRDGLDLKPDELLNLVRRHKKETIRSTENGTLYHYHQTGLENLGGILDNGALLSTEEQKKRGIKRSAAGSRPDVVQMTRDKYDAKGKLLEAGIRSTSAGLGAAGDIAFVFNESIMDDPDYDAIDRFPNVPKAPLSKLSKVLVTDERNIQHVQEVFASRGLQAEILTREGWINRYEQQPSRNSY